MKNLFLITLMILTLSAVGLPVSAQLVRGTKTSVQAIKNPIRYQSTNAYTDGRGVWIEWKTEFESNNLGYYVYRTNRNGNRELVSQFIAGAYLQAPENKITDGSYSFYDAFGTANSIYYIESLSINNQRNSTGAIQTQTVKDLTELAGVSSEQLNAQSRNANSIVVGSDSQLPSELMDEIKENRPAADPIKQRWVAAQPGVRIGVKQEGFYRVSRASLAANGFDVNSSRSLWQLYVNGVEQAINVSDDGEYIEFYGRGIDTIESNTQTYFLIVGDTEGKRIGEIFRRRINSGVLSESYDQTFSKKERVFYSQIILNGDAENIFGNVANATGRNYEFTLTGVDFSKPTASMDLTVQGVTLVAHNFRVVINGTEVGTISGNNYSSLVKHFEFSTALLREGSNTLFLQSLIPTGDNVAFDTMKVNFARKYQADQNRLSFYVPNYKAAYAGNFTSPNIRVFDVTSADSPMLIGGLAIDRLDEGNFRVYLPSNRSRLMFAIEDSGILQPAIISQNIPSTLSNVSNNGEFLIISHRDFLTQAEDWANYRRSQGLTVKVVDIEDVFDEFNYGVLSPDSIREFLRYAKQNWQTAPNYVLLIGDATYDPKNYFALGGNFVPTRMFDSIYTEAGSDETMADFDNDGLAEIAVGRIPARTPAVVTLMLNKVIAFEQNVGQNGLSRGALFAYDIEDGYSFEGLSGRLRDQLPSNIERAMVGRALPNANALLMSNMNAGKFIVNYSGHGSSNVWATTGFFGNAGASQLTNSGGNLSIFTMLTCLNGYFSNNSDSLSEVLLKNANGGAVSAWASTGLTTPDIQEVMATRFYNQVTAGNITRMGDLIKDAKTTINYGRDVRLSWVLLGDPTMKVR